ncbi:MAG: hypothetical protein GEU89_11685 [Kiloniellaceae bacterium]|nr:hypothetical protein [Kiloniellaceae bacterium]
MLDLARRDAKRVPVGRCGDSNPLMVKLARRGRQVVRLLAGDADILGRAGAEVAALQAAGIPVSVVLGGTPSVGGTAATSLPQIPARRSA